MPKPHTGMLSGVAYTIPELDDVGNVEVAFSEFADTIPASPAAIKTITVMADVPAPELNALYVFDGTGPNTLTLHSGLRDGDKIQVFQAQNGIVTVDPNSIPVKGPLTTSGPFSALTLIWQATEGRWVSAPFFSSGISFPPASEGGDEIIDAGGFRYHVFYNSGSFYSHKDMPVNVLVVGAGGDGASAGAAAGDGGSPGGYLMLQAQNVEQMQSYRVVVGKTPQAVGEASSFDGKTAAGGAAGVTGVATPVVAPVSLPLDVAAALGVTQVGGNGPANSGPITPTRYGMGGGGAFLMMAEQGRTQTTINHPGSPGSPGYTESYGVSATRHENTYEHRGDTRPVYCPDGWRVSLVDHSFVQCQNIANPSQVAMNGWMGGCPGGWYACGMNCCTMITDVTWSCPGGCTNHNNGSCTCYREVAGTPGSPGWTETVWAACPTDFKPKPGDESKCVDARSPLPGQGGDGLVVVWYPL